MERILLVGEWPAHQGKKYVTIRSSWSRKVPSEEAEGSAGLRLLIQMGPVVEALVFMSGKGRGRLRYSAASNPREEEEEEIMSVTTL
jgi:hypothetical protein